MKNVVEMTGGEDGTYFEILCIEGQGVTKYYSAIVNGVEKSYFDFPNIDDYLKAKVEKTRLTVRVTVAGNAVSAENAIMETTGCNCMAVGPNTVDIYYTEEARDAGDEL